MTATSAGRYVGAAVRIDQINAEPQLRSAILRDCGSITPEIHMKWDSLQPERGVWNFAPADGLASFARTNGLKVRGHALLWDQSTPGWVRDQLKATPNSWNHISRYFGTVMNRYRNAVDEWDVVNEPIDTEGGVNGLRKTVFYNAYGSSYIERALHEARFRAPTARLAINEYGLEYDNPVDEARRVAMLRLLERLRQNGVPIDVVGIQAHLDLGKGAPHGAAINAFFSVIADMGLKIAITELDVKEVSASGAVSTRDQRVADHVRAYLDIVNAHPAVMGVTTWGLSDRHSWLQNQPVSPTVNAARLNRGLPYDANLRAKPMHSTLHQAMTDAELAAVTTR